MSETTKPMRWEPPRRSDAGVVAQTFHAATGERATRIKMPGRCARVFWGSVEPPTDFRGPDAWNAAGVAIEQRYAA